MKKFGKFVFTTVSIAAAVGAGVYFVKNVLNKNADDDFDDFDDDFDDFEDFNEENDVVVTADETNREYVTINRTESPTVDTEPTEETE